MPFYPPNWNTKTYAYTWVGGRESLVGQNNTWLRNACRERGITGFSKMNRHNLLEALLAWEAKR